jgi:capsular polysaccharide biosynthesis protein
MYAPSPGTKILDLETRDLILHIRQRRWRYLLIIILSGLISFWFFKYKLLSSSSTVSFFINDQNIVSLAADLPKSENLISATNYNRIYQLVNSYPIHNHLIRKFNLLQHYGIDSTKEFYLQRAAAMLKSKISISNSPFGVVSVTVKDPDRYLSAKIANEIVSYIEQLNQNYFVNSIQKKIAVAESYMKQLQADNFSKGKMIDTLLTKFNAILKQRQLRDRDSYIMLSEQLRLNQLVSIFQTSTFDLINSQKLYNSSIQAMDFNIYPTITILQSAMPAFRSTGNMAILYSVGVMLLISMLMVIQAYFFMKYSTYFKFILRGDK